MRVYAALIRDTKNIYIRVLSSSSREHFGTKFLEAGLSGTYTEHRKYRTGFYPVLAGINSVHNFAIRNYCGLIRGTYNIYTGFYLVLAGINSIHNVAIRDNPGIIWHTENTCPDLIRSRSRNIFGT